MMAIAGVGSYYYFGGTLPSPPPPPPPPPATSKHTFTWLSCDPVTPTIVSWCKEIGLTDVAIRWGQDFQADYPIFANVGITMWDCYCWQTLGNYGQDYLSLLQTLVSETPGGHVYLDDCHYILNTYGSGAFAALLNAARTVQTFDSAGYSNLIICLYWSGSSNPYSSFNFAKIDVDFYTEPNHDYMTLPSVGAASVGGYVWAWRQGWSGVTTAQAQQIYTVAKTMNFSRMTDWTGYEPFYHEAQMDAASLYLHPEWWSTIGQLNRDFLASG